MCGQQGEGGDPAPLNCVGETSPGVLRPDVESSVQERHGAVRACPKEGHKNDPRDGTSLLRGQVKKVEAVQFGEEKPPGRPQSGLSLSEVGSGVVRKKGADSLAECVVTGQGEMVSN